MRSSTFDHDQTPAQICELLARTHYVIACSTTVEIAWCDGPVYPHTRGALVAAIALAYPELAGHVEEVMAVWADCQESIAYCVRKVRETLCEQAIEDAQCEGHESLAGAHMGESVYCDGTCRPASVRKAARDWVAMLAYFDAK
jgi:hypothetical protein